MIDIKNKKDCCGCWGCDNICPVECITMIQDQEGFHYPKVNLDECIDCHLCEKVCPEINVEPEEVNPNQEGYLLQLKDDEIRKWSTSGGAFTAIASWVIGQGGVVFGAAMNVETFEVHHRSVDTIEGLGLFRMSKYVQSYVDDCYSQVRKLLKANLWVCFTGTPCQIEGLHHFLSKKHYEKLVLVDVVCYGIPSPGVFKNYMIWKQKQIGGKFTKVLFREKILSYNYTSLSIYNEDSQKDYHKGVEHEQFMRSFFSDINVRPACYDCRFKKRYRVSDFTIWDCYDVKAFSKNFDENGTNRVLVHSLLGKRILMDIKSTIREEPYLNLDYFIADEVAMMKSVPMEPRRVQFFKDYQIMSMSELMQKWYPTTMKVRLNSFLRMMAFKLGIYNQSKKMVKVILKKIKSLK